MSKPSRTTIAKAIIKAYRDNAVIVVSLPTVKDSLSAKKAVRQFGPVTSARTRGRQTIYGYESTVERIVVIQYVDVTVGNPKPDAQKQEAKQLSAARQREIEKTLIDAYKRGAQFIIGFQPATSLSEAKQNIRHFGQPKQITTSDGRTTLLIDDAALQVEVRSIVGFPNT